jgi:hypothetical protein
MNIAYARKLHFHKRVAKCVLLLRGDVSASRLLFSVEKLVLPCERPFM